MDRICEGCGCTDEAACEDPESPSGTCFWWPGSIGDVCSVCARLALSFAANDQQRPEPGEPSGVEVYSPYEAQQFIDRTAEARAAMRMVTG